MLFAEMVGFIDLRPGLDKIKVFAVIVYRVAVKRRKFRPPAAKGTSSASENAIGWQ
jgi:hypothetical protein